MRTIKEAMAWIMETDPNTSITPHALRRLIVSGEIPRVVVSNKCATMASPYPSA